MNRLRFAQAWKQKPVELLAASLMVVLGIVLVAFWTDPQLNTLATIVSTVGGILFSWAIATVTDREQAAELLRPQLEATGRHLGSISSQLSRLVNEFNTEQIDPETGFRLVAHANQTLYNLVTDIQNLAGTPFDAQALLDTVEQLEDLAIRLSGHEAEEHDENEETSPSAIDQVNISQELANEVQSLRAQLSSLVRNRESQGMQKVRGKINCPNCSALVEVLLPAVGGTSTSPRCPRCNNVFQANRKRNGDVTTKSIGNSIALPSVTPNEQILKNQGIRLVSPKSRLLVLHALVSAFADAQNNRFKTKEELELKISKILLAKGNSLNLTDIKKIRELAYKARIFTTDDTRNIVLSPGTSVDNADSIVVRTLISRLIGHPGVNLNANELNKLLYDGDESKLQSIQEYLTEAKSLSSEISGNGN